MKRMGTKNRSQQKGKAALKLSLVISLVPFAAGCLQPGSGNFSGSGSVAATPSGASWRSHGRASRFHDERDHGKLHCPDQFRNPRGRRVRTPSDQPVQSRRLFAGPGRRRPIRTGPPGSARSKSESPDRITSTRFQGARLPILRTPTALVLRPLPKRRAEAAKHFALTAPIRTFLAEPGRNVSGQRSGLQFRKRRRLQRRGHR